MDKKYIIIDAIGTVGTSGTSGVNGTSGSSGWSGGSSGTSGNGTSGTSGESGTSGTSGESGTSGTSGLTGTSGTSGLEGTSGTSGVNGTSGTSGISGTSGNSGTSGTSGNSGTSGTSGNTGTSGTSGKDGTFLGSSGTSGNTGTSGTSGINGTSGTSGISGISGSSGVTPIVNSYNNLYYDSGTTTLYTPKLNISNLSNITDNSTKLVSVGGLILQVTGITTGTSGSSGTSGVGSPGSSGTSGVGSPGTSGTSGINGTSGTSGINGTSGTSGVNGTSGTAGSSGLSPTFVVDNLFYYNTGTTTLYVPKITTSSNLYVGGLIQGPLGPLGFPTYVFVGDTLSEFPTLHDSLTWLASGKMSGNTTLVLTADNETITSPITINLPFQLTITSGGYGQSILTAGAGCSNTPLFTLQSNVSFTRLILDAGTATGTTTAINIATDDLYIEFKDSTIDGGFNKGIFSSSNTEFWVFESIIDNCKVAGFELNTTTTGAKYRSSFVDYSATSAYNDYVGINLISGNTVYISSESDTSELTTTGQTFIKKPDNTNINFLEFVVIGDVWNNVGNFKSGFDFTRADGRDADIVMLSNNGQEDQKPHAKVNVINNTGTTSATVNWVKCNFNVTNYYIKKLKIDNNKITYLPTHVKDMMIWISGAITTSTQPAVITLAIVKNSQTGTTYGATTQTLSANSSKYIFSTNVYIPDVAYNDYIELYCQATGNDTIIIEDMNMLIITN